MPRLSAAARTERRHHDRGAGIPIEPPGIVRINFDQQQDPIADAQVLNMSPGGAALRSRSPVVPGERIAFNLGQGHPPVLCGVLGCERTDDGWFRIRCKCILGGFDLDPDDDEDAAADE